MVFSTSTRNGCFVEALIHGPWHLSMFNKSDAVWCCSSDWNSRPRSRETFTLVHSNPNSNKFRWNSVSGKMNYESMCCHRLARTLWFNSCEDGEHIINVDRPLGMTDCALPGTFSGLFNRRNTHANVSIFIRVLQICNSARIALSCNGKLNCMIYFCICNVF